MPSSSRNSATSRSSTVRSGSFSSFAAGFSYISILTGMFQTSYLGFLFAGPAFIWAWIFVLFGQMMVALQFAELSAHYPLAGSVYQWSKQVAGKSWAWNTGWMYLCAQIVTVPAVALGWQVILPQISTRFVFVGSPADQPTTRNPNFAKNAIVLGVIMITLTTIINVLGVSVLSKINNVGVAAELIGATGLVLLFLFHANRSPSDVLTNTAGTGSGPLLGLPRSAPDRGDHAAVRDVRVRHGRIAGRGDRRPAAPRAAGDHPGAVHGRHSWASC